MKSNMTFLAPLLAGIVVGLSAMITGILSQLTDLLNANTGEGVAGLGNMTQIIELFKIQNLIPPYFLQISIGVYIVEVIFILTSTLVTIDSGEDKLKQTYEVGRNLIIGGTLYLIVALLSVLVLAGLASVALGGIVGI